MHCKLNSLRRGIQTHLLQSVNDTKEYYISFQYNTFYMYICTYNHDPDEEEDVTG